ncbi:hypothetical protein PAS25_18805 [Leclercia adecarboxylata]|nr:hypothetical protein [Leclercia adecarboxylata]
MSIAIAFCCAVLRSFSTALQHNKICDRGVVDKKGAFSAIKNHVG